VGVYEANAIALEMEKVNTPRPMTHDLIKNVLTGLETAGHKGSGDELREDTFLCGDLAGAETGKVISIDFASVGMRWRWRCGGLSDLCG